MSTSGGTALNAIGYLLVVVATLVVAGRVSGGSPGRLLVRPSPAALVIWAVVAVPSILQIPFPALLDALSRRPELIAEGQVWRLLTSVVVQDGGVAGTVSNLLLLYLVVCAAVPVWGGVRAGVLFALSVLGFNLMATYVFPQFGAGNSGAMYALAASTLAAVAVWHRAWWTVAAAALAAVVGVGLLTLGDAHGFAFLGGLVLGVVGALVTPAARAGQGRRPWKSSVV